MNSYTRILPLLKNMIRKVSNNIIFSFLGTASIEKPILNNLLGRHLTNSLCKTLQNCEIFKDADIDMEKILTVSLTRLFRKLFELFKNKYSL